MLAGSKYGVRCCQLHSHGWSILSGISSSQVTRIGVICLPLHEIEVKRFLDLAFPHWPPIRRVTSSAAKTIQNHIDDLQHELDGFGISAGPMGDELVSLPSAAITCELNLSEFQWRATMQGPVRPNSRCHVRITYSYSATPPMQVVLSSSGCFSLESTRSSKPRPYLRTGSIILMPVQEVTSQ